MRRLVRRLQLFWSPITVTACTVVLLHLASLQRHPQHSHDEEQESVLYEVDPREALAEIDSALGGNIGR